MKGYTVLFFLLLCFADIVTAQTKYGLKLGLNISDQYKEISTPGYAVEKIETKILPGFQIGAFIKHALNQEFGLAAELNFSTLGSKTKYTRTDFMVNPDGTISGSTTGYFDDRIQAIEIPLFVDYHINHFYVGLGPTVGLILSSRIKNHQNSSFKSTYNNSFDLGISPIVGYSLQKKIDIALKYNYGLTDIDKIDYSVIKNRVVIFSVLYSLK